DDREAISRHEGWDDLKQIPSTPRILIVDADPCPAQLLKSRLKKFGIEVLTATDGFHGFQVARNEMPSMIVAARNSPDCDVEHLLWKLRSTPRTKQLPVFVMAETSARPVRTTLSVMSPALPAPPSFLTSLSTLRRSTRRLNDIAVSQSRRRGPWRPDRNSPAGGAPLDKVTAGALGPRLPR